MFLPGSLPALVTLTGLAGLALTRRTAAAALLWLCATATVVLPAAEHEYVYRYVMPAVPLLCLAAALALRPLAATPSRSSADSHVCVRKGLFEQP